MPMPKTMRAAIIVRPREIRIDDLALPDPGARQVRIRLEGCGVCHSNLPTWQGREWFRYPQAPGAPGHEGWGRVEATGSGVTAVGEGDRVAFLSGNAYCDHAVVSEAELLALPAALDTQPFPGEPLGCALNIFRRAEVREGHTVAIVGIGFLGALLVQLCANAGARVLAVAHRPFSQDLARRFSADAVVPMDDHGKVIERVRELTSGRFCDRAIECVGAQWPLDLAGELTGERGRLVIAGYHQDGPRRVDLQLWNWRGLDVVNAHERDPAVYLDGMRRAAGKVASGELDPRPLYTEFPLEELSSAFEALERRPDGFVKALVRM
jgi:threonine dehydrogenase-like Zn-dependent dehydrogenase